MTHSPFLKYSIFIFYPLTSMFAACVPIVTILCFIGVFKFDLIYISLIPWHAYHMIFGYFYYMISGFILTAGCAWTGREPIAGKPLLAMIIFILIENIFSVINWPILYFLSSTIFPILLIYYVYQILKSYQLRNFFVFIYLGVSLLKELYLANNIFDLKLSNNLLIYLSLWFYTILLITIAGRVIPRFTQNYFKLNHQIGEPLYIKKITFISTLLIPLHYLYQELTIIFSVHLVLTGILHFIRMLFWSPQLALKNMSIGYLHLGYFLLSISLVIIGLQNYFTEWNFLKSIEHFYLIGPISIIGMTMMLRATLGHLKLKVTFGITEHIILIAIILSLLLRTFVPITHSVNFLIYFKFAAVLFSIANLLFLIKFIPKIARSTF